jgi:hypothetical protein
MIVEDHGSIDLLYPETVIEKEWITLHVSDPRYFGGGLIVEDHYAETLLSGIVEAGFPLTYREIE